MKKNANKGFSLVELIIVIAIMAVLIGVLAPQFIKQVEKSRESTDLQNLEEIKTAVETYVAEHGESITDTVEVAIDTSTKKITVTGGVTTANLSEYGVSDTAIKSTKWTGNLTYQYPTSGTGAYAWKLKTTPQGHATYFNLDGTNYTPTT